MLSLRRDPIASPRRLAVLLLLALLADGLAAEDGGPNALSEARAALRAAEQAFADAFARRDRDAFAGFVAIDAVFMGRGEPLRGRSAVMEVWSRYLESDPPPFSWRPERVEVNDAGNLGVSTGPVLDRDGNWMGTFTTTWRRDADGDWQVIFDTAPRCPDERDGS